MIGAHVTISTDGIFVTKCNAAISDYLELSIGVTTLGDGLDVSIGSFVTTCSS